MKIIKYNNNILILQISQHNDIQIKIKIKDYDKDDKYKLSN